LGSKGKKLAWVKWDNNCKPKEEGGLGTIDIKMFNVALLGKWNWRLAMGEERL